MDIEQISADGIPLNIADTQARQDITEIKSNLTELRDYSTNEIVVGTWIDGKPIYQKTITIGNIGTNSAWQQFPHNISNLDKTIDFKAMLRNNDDQFWYKLPTTRPASNPVTGVIIAIRYDYIAILNTWLANGRDCFVTIQYTKTTD